MKCKNGQEISGPFLCNIDLMPQILTFFEQCVSKKQKWQIVVFLTVNSTACILVFMKSMWYDNKSYKVFVHPIFTCQYLIVDCKYKIWRMKK